MGHHQLKVLPCYFEAAEKGLKPFEIRDNTDRGFQRGDTVELLEYEAGRYTSRSLLGEITYVTNFEQKPNWVVFGIKKRRRKSARN